jgi:hypothetical protein
MQENREELKAEITERFTEYKSLHCTLLADRTCCTNDRRIAGAELKANY